MVARGDKRQVGPHTCSPPMETVTNQVFGTFWVGIYLHLNMFVFRPAASVRRIRSTVVDMNMPSHGTAYHRAEHWSSFVIRAKFSSIEFECCAIRSIYSPLGLGHRSMERIVLLLHMPYGKSQHV